METNMHWHCTSDNEQRQIVEQSASDHNRPNVSNSDSYNKALHHLLMWVRHNGHDAHHNQKQEITSMRLRRTHFYLHMNSRNSNRIVDCRNIQVTTAEGLVKKFKGENNLIMRKLKAGEFKTKVGRWTRAVSDRIQCELNRKVMEEGLALLASAVQDLEGRQRKCIEEERRMSDLSKSLLEEVERREDDDIEAAVAAEAEEGAEGED